MKSNMNGKRRGTGGRVAAKHGRSKRRPPVMSGKVCVLFMVSCDTRVLHKSESLALQSPPQCSRTVESSRGQKSGLFVYGVETL